MEHAGSNAGTKVHTSTLARRQRGSPVCCFNLPSRFLCPANETTESRIQKLSIRCTSISISIRAPSPSSQPRPVLCLPGLLPTLSMSIELFIPLFLFLGSLPYQRPPPNPPSTTIPKPLLLAASSPTTIPVPRNSTNAASMSHPRRNFNPKKSPRFGVPTFTPSVLVKYSPKWKYRRLFSFPFSGSHFRPRMRTLVLSIDGGCRINNRQDANSRAAYAVYFGPGSVDNHAATLAHEEPHTSNRAELHAAIAALEVVERKRDGGELELVREVILMTDSEYVARSMDSWVWNWERNGWRKKKGGAVENQDLLGALHGMMERLEMSGMRILFWRVGREWNVEADEMVNAVLDATE